MYSVLGLICCDWSVPTRTQDKVLQTLWNCERSNWPRDWQSVQTDCVLCCAVDQTLCQCAVAETNVDSSGGIKATVTQTTEQKISVNACLTGSQQYPSPHTLTIEQWVCTSTDTDTERDWESFCLQLNKLSLNSNKFRLVKWWCQFMHCSSLSSLPITSHHQPNELEEVTHHRRFDSMCRIVVWRIMDRGIKPGYHPYATVILCQHPSHLRLPINNDDWLSSQTKITFSFTFLRS